jgi:flagellar assembly protein FliH
MYSSTEVDGIADAPVAALQYRDISDRAEREPATQPRNSGRSGTEKGDAGAASKHSAAETAALVEREKAGAALEVEQRLRKEYEQKLLAERTAIAEIVAGFAEQRNEYYARVEAEIVQLALSIAAKILHREAQVDPMLLAALVRIAVEKMREGSGVILRVSPKRADSWRRYFAEFPNMSHVEVAEDASLSDQDCIVGTELGSANFGLDTQLKEVEQGFFDLLALRPATK